MPALAGRLASGQHVALERIAVFEFRFDPDEPVAAFHNAEAGAESPHRILSMGRCRKSHRGGRSGMARRGQASRAGTGKSEAPESSTRGSASGL